MDDTESIDQDGIVSENGEPSLSMTDIYFLLLADLSEVSDLVENARIHANENQPRQSWGAYIASLKSELNNSQNFPSYFKKNFMDALSRNADDVKLLGEPFYSANVSFELRSKLCERVKYDRENIQQMTSQLSKLQESNKEISRQILELDDMMAGRATSGEMKTQFKWEEIRKKVKLQRAKLVKDIRHVTNELCADSSIPDVLTSALKKSADGKDPYIDVNDSSVEELDFLLRCNLIVRHPHDRKLVRLPDLI